MSEQCYVEIVETKTGEVIRRLGPHSNRKARKIENGINVNINDEIYHTRIVTEPEVSLEGTD